MQLGLHLRPPATRCLSTIETVRDWMRLTHDQVMAAIESGIIPFAFDLRFAAQERSEIRIWHPTVEALVESDGKDSGPRPPFDQVIEQLVPDRFDIKSSSLETLWSVSHTHIHRLIRSGAIPAKRVPRAAHGPASCALLYPNGLRQFLYSRRFVR